MEWYDSAGLDGSRDEVESSYVTVDECELHATFGGARVNIAEMTSIVCETLENLKFYGKRRGTCSVDFTENLDVSSLSGLHPSGIRSGDGTLCVGVTRSNDDDELYT